MHVIGTAGHVDHGKSALVRALTGIEPDRLAEEKERGLTIELGYAWTQIDGEEVAIVDVPGHERFISTMLAGAGQADVVLFVVDAREGWKPQSEEHLQIVDLLGRRHAVVALTKSDLVDDIPAAATAVRARIDGSSIAEAPVIAVSALTGSGLEELRAALGAALAKAGAPSEDPARPRVWLDRSFTIKGAGTVVTGTLSGGSIASGDQLEIVPSGRRARVRRIQTHERERERAEPVSRVALNLAGVNVDDVTRGDAAVIPGSFEVTREVDVWLRATGQVGPRGAYKAHIGSADTDARLTLIWPEEIAPGQAGFARLRLGRALPLQPGDPFVIRDTSRRATAGGGAILDVRPPARAKGRRDALERRRAALAPGAAPGELAATVLAEMGRAARADLARLSGTRRTPGDAVVADEVVFDPAWYRATSEAVASTLRRFHADRPMEVAMPLGDLSVATGLDPATIDEVAAVTAEVEIGTGGARLTGHAPSMPAGQREAAGRLRAELEAAGASPPTRDELEARYGPDLVAALVRSGELVTVSPAFVWSSEILTRVKSLIEQAAGREGPLTAARIKDLIGTSRKWAIPLLEHLDATGFTRRDGDVRHIRPR